MKFFLISAYIIISALNSLYAQDTPRAVGGYTVFTIPFEGDSVTLAVVAKPGELKAKKPVFLFRKGSLPIPLFTINPRIILK